MSKKDFSGLLKLANSPLVEYVKQQNNHGAENPILSQKNVVTETKISIIVDGFKSIEKKEYSIVARQLTAWGILNSGAVIKREGPCFVKAAMEITRKNIEKARSPKAYFRGVLKKLQEAAAQNYIQQA